MKTMKTCISDEWHCHTFRHCTQFFVDHQVIIRQQWHLSLQLCVFKLTVNNGGLKESHWCICDSL
jgi:hypothetical protein